MADSSFVSMESEETNAKDELVKQHMKIAEEAIAGTGIVHRNDL